MLSRIPMIIGSNKNKLEDIVRNMKSFTSTTLRKVKENSQESRKEWIVWMRALSAFIFTFLIISHGTAVCQSLNLNPKEWAKKLADPSDKKNDASFTLSTILQKQDSASDISFLDKLSNEPSAKGHYFIARFNCVKAYNLLVFYGPKPLSPFTTDSIKREVTKLLEEAMNQAFIVDDDYLAAYVSSIYGTAMDGFHNTEKAVMYMMYSADLYQKVKLHGAWDTYFLLGEMLWRVREYQKSIQYTKIAIPLVKVAHPVTKIYLMMCNNTIALSFHRMGKYDSALYYYNKALQLASEENDKKTGKIWQGIVSGNIAQIDFAQGNYTTALPLFMMDYQTSIEFGVYDEAGNSIQWAAKTNLALGNKKEALLEVRESFNLLNKWQNPANYRQNAYQTASQIFKALGDNDSAYYYSAEYNALHDSLERVIYQSSISISKLRLDNEKNRYNIQNIEREKKGQLEMRDSMIVAILLLCAVAMLLINRQLQKTKVRAQLEQHEKRRIEQEMESAREQLKMFTKSIIEKTSLIEKLESQMENKLKTQEQQQLVEELSRQSILTEEDWLNFKSLFEKLHVGFFEKINKHVNNITQAEQRMAALTLLHLNTKQIAGLLGISPNSVIKAKHRMRDRFNLQTDQEVENFIASL
jgi:DNA-binding CsgD family transcriptional regulator/tetratricopeptide (TPR) repeat protein